MFPSFPFRGAYSILKIHSPVNFLLMYTECLVRNALSNSILAAFVALSAFYELADAAPTATSEVATTFDSAKLASYTGAEDLGYFDACPSDKPSSIEELPALQGYEVPRGSETVSLILESYDNKATPTLAVDTTIHSTPATITIGPSATPVRLATFSAPSSVVVICFSTDLTTSGSRSVGCKSDGLTSLTMPSALSTGLSRAQSEIGLTSATAISRFSPTPTTISSGNTPISTSHETKNNPLPSGLVSAPQ